MLANGEIRRWECHNEATNSLYHCLEIRTVTTHDRITGKHVIEIKVDIMLEEEILYKQVTRNFVAETSRRTDRASTSETGYRGNFARDYHSRSYSVF